ncbi:YqaJ viral recombinase family protein [Variovorax sp. tm]|uniref:YqaJ viral recombinase family nuclease n=1 Tax=Variovorax atrisoli TaxID=3394203 RepID=UPI003A7FF143
MLTSDIKPQEITPARWPDMREAGIGCFDAAAAVDRDPVKSQIRLWMEKTGRHALLQPEQQTPAKSDTAIHQGICSASYWRRLLEPVVAAHYTLRTGLRVRRTKSVVRHPRHPWMLAHPGREVVDCADVQWLECKCVGMAEASLWQQGLPEHVRIQMLHRLAITSAKAVDVVALIGGEELRIDRVVRDEVEIARLIDAEREFWRCVEIDQAPNARGGVMQSQVS